MLEYWQFITCYFVCVIPAADCPAGLVPYKFYSGACNNKLDCSDEALNDYPLDSTLLKVRLNDILSIQHRTLSEIVVVVFFFFFLYFVLLCVVCCVFVCVCCLFCFVVFLFVVTFFRFKFCCSFTFDPPLFSLFFFSFFFFFNIIYRARK